MWADSITGYPGTLFVLAWTLLWMSMPYALIWFVKRNA